MPGLNQHYRCGNCSYEGSVKVPLNAAREVLLEAASSDHRKHRSDCSDPRLELTSAPADDSDPD